MRGNRSILKIVGLLALLIMMPTSAEVDHGIDPVTGRSLSYGAGSVGLGSTLSGCAVGRPGAGGVIGGVATGPVVGAAPQSQGGTDLGGGIIQASVPPGAVAASPSATGSTASAKLGAEAILQGKCKVCHTPGSNLPKINAASGLAAVSGGKMPKPPVTLTPEEKDALTKAWTNGTLL